MNFVFIEAIRSRSDLYMAVQNSQFEGFVQNALSVLTDLTQQLEHGSGGELKGRLHEAQARGTALFEEAWGMVGIQFPIPPVTGLAAEINAIRAEESQMSVDVLKGPYLAQLKLLRIYIEYAATMHKYYKNHGCTATLIYAIWQPTSRDDDAILAYNVRYDLLNVLKEARDATGVPIAGKLFDNSQGEFTSFNSNFDLEAQSARPGIAPIYQAILMWAARGDTSISDKEMQGLFDTLNNSDIGQTTAERDQAVGTSISNAMFEALKSQPDALYMQENGITAATMVWDALVKDDVQVFSNPQRLARDWTTLSGLDAPDFSGMGDSAELRSSVYNTLIDNGIEAELERSELEMVGHWLEPVRNFGGSGAEPVMPSSDPHPEFAQNTKALERYEALIPFTDHAKGSDDDFRKMGFGDTAVNGLYSLALYDARVEAAAPIIESILQDIKDRRATLISDLVGDSTNAMVQDITAAVSDQNSDALMNYVYVLDSLEYPESQDFEQALYRAGQSWPTLADGTQSWLDLSREVDHDVLWQAGLKPISDKANDGADTCFAYKIIDAAFEALKSQPDAQYMQENSISAVSALLDILNGKYPDILASPTVLRNSCTGLPGIDSLDFSRLSASAALQADILDALYSRGIEGDLKRSRLELVDYWLKPLRDFANTGADAASPSDDPHPEFEQNAAAAERFQKLIPFENFAGGTEDDFKKLGFSDDAVTSLYFLALYDERVEAAAPVIAGFLQDIADQRKKLDADVVGDAFDGLKQDIATAISTCNIDKLTLYANTLAPLEKPGPQGFHRALNQAVRDWPALARGAQDWLALSREDDLEELWESGLSQAHQKALEGIDIINNVGAVLPDCYRHLVMYSLTCNVDELRGFTEIFQASDDTPVDPSAISGLVTADHYNNQIPEIAKQGYLRDALNDRIKPLESFGADRLANTAAIVAVGGVLDRAIAVGKSYYVADVKDLDRTALTDGGLVIGAPFMDADQDGADDNTGQTMEDWLAGGAETDLDPEDQEALDAIQYHEALTRFGRLHDWLGEVAGATGGRHRYVADLISTDQSEVLGDDIAAGIANSYANMDTADFDTAELSRIGYGRLSRDVFGKQIRIRQIKMCQAMLDAVKVWSDRVSDGVSQQPFIDDALMRVVDVVIDDMIARCESPDYHAEWPSGLASSYASLHPLDEAPPERAEILTLLSDLQDSWYDDKKSYVVVARAFAGTDTTIVVTGQEDSGIQDVSMVADNTAMAMGMDLLANAPGNIMGALMERIPALQIRLAPKAADRPGSIAFVESHELDFRLHNDRGAEELSSLMSHDMVLELINASRRTITLGAPLAPPDAPDALARCHFILRFRPGTLDPDLENIDLDGPDPVEGGHWQIVGRKPHSRTQPDYDELYIAGPQGHKIKPGQSRHIILQQMLGADNGTRITRVLLLHQGLKHGDEAMEPGLRERRLTVSNTMPDHDARAMELPISVAFVRANQILNDEGQSTSILNIALTNVQTLSDRRPVGFRAFKQIAASDIADMRRSWQRSRVTVTVDTYDPNTADAREWAMCSTAEATSIQATLYYSVDDSVGWDGAFTNQGSVAEWVFTPPPNRDDKFYTLERGQGLYLDLDEIRSSTYPGPCNIYVRIENIPGFPDREYVLTAQKAMLIESGSFIGVNTSDPSVQLDVEGDVDISDTLSVGNVYMPVVPVGAILPFVGQDTPEGWLLCDGTILEEVDDPEDDPFVTLRDMLRPLGKDGEIDYKADVHLPDMRGRVVVGAAWDNSAEDEVEANFFSGNTNGRALDWGSEKDQGGNALNDLFPGTRGGSWLQALNQFEIPNHEHVRKWDQPTGDTPVSYGHKTGTRGNLHIGSISSLSPNIKGEAHNNMPPFVVYTYIIKY